MPLPPPSQLNVERHIMTLTRTTPPAELRVYATRVHANGREALRAELDSDTPAEITVTNKNGSPVGVITLPAGRPTFWPGPTASERIGLGGNRSFADTNLSVSL